MNSIFNPNDICLKTYLVLISVSFSLSVRAQTGTCTDPFILNLDHQWTTVGSINTTDKVWYEFTSPDGGMLEYCPTYGTYSVEILSSCDPLDIVHWTDTGIECAAPTPFCPDPQTLKIYRTIPGEVILIGAQGTEDPFTCVGPIDIRYVQGGDLCGLPTPIQCGDTVQFTTDLLSPRVGLFACSGPTPITTTGQDKTFVMNFTTPQDITITMNSTKGDRDALGVYRVCNDCQAGCFFTGCEAFSSTNGQETIVLTGVTGEILIACDWEPTDQADQDDGNEFQLSVSCGPCTMNDIVDPVVSCPVTELVVFAPDGQNCAEVFYPQANASDNCQLDNVTYSMSSGSCFPLGVTIVTVTATDASGNTSSCSFSVTVEEYVCCLDMTLEGNNLFNTLPQISPVFMDVDNDGDVDWLISATEYYENISSVGVDPDFDTSSGPKTISHSTSFSSVVYDSYYYNPDGFEDIFAVDQNMTLLYCENKGLPNSASFEVINTGLTIPFNGADFTSASISIGDLGNDGLPDLVVGSVGTQNTLSVVYYEHILGANCANQLCFNLAGNSYTNPFINGPLNGVEFPYVEIYDGNCDGNEDLYVGLLGEIRLFRNMGGMTPQGNTPPLDIQNPIPNPHGIHDLEPFAEEFTTPRFVDADSDGDTELFISELNNKVQYYENCGDLISNTSNGVEHQFGIAIFPNPTNNTITVSLEKSDAWINHVQILSIQGHEIFSQTYRGEDAIDFDFSDYPAGVYVLKVLDSTNTYYLEKIIAL